MAATTRVTPGIDSSGPAVLIPLQDGPAPPDLPTRPSPVRSPPTYPSPPGRAPTRSHQADPPRQVSPGPAAPSRPAAYGTSLAVPTGLALPTPWLSRSFLARPTGHATPRRAVPSEAKPTGLAGSRSTARRAGLTSHAHLGTRQPTPTSRYSPAPIIAGQPLSTHQTSAVGESSHPTASTVGPRPVDDPSSHLRQDGGS